MAENKEQQSPYPLAPAANGYARSDTESAYHDARELRKRKRKKCLLYIVLFVVFQTGIILLFALTVMNIRTPKFRVRSAAFENFNVGTPTNPSFSLRINAEFGIKNTNFGHFKYQNSAVYFIYGSVKVGEVVVQKARAKARSTRKFNAAVELSFPENSQLRNDLNSGFVRLISQSKLRGKVELMKVLKKNKSTDMNCSMDIVTATQQLTNIVCK
ncbi:late embryogenesis abundant At1g64065-like [Olea europaea subsp. europaea]|uniref:Late embryogenesis abundant At1g64065-like n=1 Tax=Olea europaea subsp. europaea TaxID=158383 RepID=A0A8S0R6A5_OLEEU|nr:late embryogenesis abundant At1g64065-like [Olea europaea subsp. europaea]